MPAKINSTSLTDEEKTIIKALLNQGERSQDVHILINTGRKSTINFGRISSIKKDKDIVPASREVIELFRFKKSNFDHATGLCAIEDERVIRSREAMILAVDLFNTSRIKFKAGAFVVLANIAWTYLLHEFYNRKGISIVDPNGFSLSLSNMIARADCPLNQAVVRNLNALKLIRDVVEHHKIGPFDSKWIPIFQANCLNFDNFISETCGTKSSLKNDLGFILQFSKISIGEMASTHTYDLPNHIKALDLELENNLQPGEENNNEYQFKVVYTLQSSSKSSSHIQFVQPNSAEGREIHNVLTKLKAADDLYPFKPQAVVDAVKNKNGTSEFTSDKHTRAWKYFKIRPNNKSKDPDKTNIKYCIYHKAHKDYTYSQEWIDYIIEQISNKEIWDKICKQK